MSVNHDVGLSSIQWRASNRRDRPPKGVAWSSCSIMQGLQGEGSGTYATMGNCAVCCYAPVGYKPLRRKEPRRLLIFYYSLHRAVTETSILLGGGPTALLSFYLQLSFRCVT